MKSIKPGRGPSMFSGFVGIFMIGFGVVWTVIAAQMSAIIALFGVFWTLIAVAMTVYNFRNATGEKRYSIYDITDSGEEDDPFNERFGGERDGKTKSEKQNKYCPFCGSAVKDDYQFCNNCGKKLP